MEESVFQAVRTGQWNKELRAHVSQCENCTEVSQVSCFISSMAKNLDSTEPVPDPSSVWLKVQLADQLQLEKRALRWKILPLAIGQSTIVAMLSFMIICVWPVINTYISQFLGWMSDAFLNPSSAYIQGLTWPILILPCLALIFVFLLQRLRWKSFR